MKCVIKTYGIKERVGESESENKFFSNNVALLEKSVWQRQ